MFVRLSIKKFEKINWLLLPIMAQLKVNTDANYKKIIVRLVFVALLKFVSNEQNTQISNLSVY